MVHLEDVVAYSLKVWKVWKLCLGTEMFPPQATVQQAEEFEVKVVCVLMILGQIVSNGCLHWIAAQSITTLQQAWDVLFRQFKRFSLSNELSCLTQQKSC